MVWCFDIRFERGFRKFLRHIGVEYWDAIRLAGGAKCLASADEGARQFVLDQIRISMRLHGTRRVILMLHSDCGGYGGLEAFADAQAEAAHHAGELRRAAENLVAAIPGIKAEPYFVDFEGVWALE